MTSVYPFTFVAERVAGDHAAVVAVTPAGVDAHAFELAPKQIAAMGAADLVIYQKSFNAATDAAMEQVTPRASIETGTLVILRAFGEHETDGDHEGEDHEGHDHGDYAYDPHVWLDVANMVKITDGVEAKLVELDPANAASYQANAKALTDELTALDNEFKASLGTCERKAFITSHAAFGYLADAYGLEEIAISGLSPEAQPSPARMAELQRTAKEHGVTTIFYETLVSPELSNTLARDLGLKTDLLDPVAGLSDSARGHDYIEIMRANLEALQKANTCS